jgi:hypothetical protein
MEGWMNMSSFIPRKEQILLEAVQASEKATIRLRQFAAATLSPEQTNPDIIYADANITVSVEVTQEGYLSLRLPGMLPKRNDEDRSRYLAGVLRKAIREKYRDRLPPKFGACVLVYEHIYDLSRNRRFIDHDNFELKHCQDVLEAAFLINDTAALCSAFQCSHRGETDSTSIWILTPEQFPNWLSAHTDCWKSHRKTEENP